MLSITVPRALSSIPNITVLRNNLDYGDLRLPRCATFIDDTNAFCRKFKTSCGINGVDLHDWKSHDGQSGLDEMTFAYLETGGNGRLFWPDDKSSSCYNKYQYSKDRAQILGLVKQLFFRLNQQQFRNYKYKQKTYIENPAQDERRASDPELANQPPGTKRGPGQDSASEQRKRQKRQLKTPSPSVASSTVGRPASRAGGSRKLRPHVTFKYRVLLAHTPRRVAQPWAPRGRFQDKTMAELIKELPFDGEGLRGLTFTIECEIMSTVEHILSDDEDGFTSMKQYTSMEIRKWLMDQQSPVDEKAPSLVHVAAPGQTHGQ